MIGDFVKDHQRICASASDTDGITVFAAKSEDGARRSVLVVDYRAGAREIAVDVKGVAPDCPVRAWLHDFTHDCEPVAARLAGGRLVLEKPDANSAAFLVTFTGNQN